MEVDRGTHGAKRASFQHTSYRDVALKILIANPDVDVEDLAEEFFDALVKDREAAISAAIYILANVRTSIQKPVRTRSTPAREPLEQRVINEHATAITKQIVSNLLEFVMPSGKTLARSMFGECTKAGGWLTALGKMGEPREIVGDKLTEADVQKVFKARR